MGVDLEFEVLDVINVRAASEEVFAIPEIMLNIYRLMDRKKDLLSCLVLCKAGLPVAAKAMFREMKVADFDKIFATGCDFETLNSYSRLVEIIHMPGANKSRGPRLLEHDVHDLIKRYPNLKCITWSPNIEERMHLQSETVWQLPSDTIWDKEESPVLSIAVPSFDGGRILRHRFDECRDICIRFALDGPKPSENFKRPKGTRRVEYLMLSRQGSLQLDHLSRLNRVFVEPRRLHINVWSNDPRSMGTSIPSGQIIPVSEHLKDLTMRIVGRPWGCMKWLSSLSNIEVIRIVDAILKCTPEDILELAKGDHPRIDYLELDCIFPEDYCQYRVVRFLGLLAVRTTIIIPLVYERKHVEKLFSLREELELQEEVEHLRRGPFEKFVTLMPKGEIEAPVVKEKPADPI